MVRDFVAAHWAVISFVSAYLFIGAVSCLPEPGDPRPFGTKFYDAVYRFLHLISNKAVERNPKLAAVPAPVPNLPPQPPQQGK